MADESTRWSHSSGEMKNAQERINRANDATVENATVGVSGNTRDIRLMISSGNTAKKKRQQNQEEREKREREERERAEREERERADREAKEREREREREARE